MYGYGYINVLNYWYRYPAKTDHFQYRNGAVIRRCMYPLMRLRIMNDTGMERVTTRSETYIYIVHQSEMESTEKAKKSSKINHILQTTNLR